MLGLKKTANQKKKGAEYSGLTLEEFKERKRDDRVKGDKKDSSQEEELAGNSSK